MMHIISAPLRFGMERYTATKSPPSNNNRRIYQGSRLIAQRITALMAERGITIAALAERLGCTASHVAAITKNRCNFPVDARDRWADALGLLGHDREPFQVMAAFAVLDECGVREVTRLRALAGVG